LLWRTLAEMPESYREPLVLFYREDRSVAEVAMKLDLTEDAVKQRLSRGRAMLREEMAALVESTLVRSKPSAAFPVGGLAALPEIVSSSAKAAVIASVASGKGTVAKGVLASISPGVILGPAFGLLVGLSSAKALVSTARSTPERICIWRHALWMIFFCLAMSI